MSIKVSVAAAVIFAGATMQAAAFEGYDADNNPLPGLSSARGVPASAFAARTRPGTPAVHNDARSPRTGDVRLGETKTDQPNAVYWRGRYLGTDPDPQVRLRMLREAIGG